MVRIHAGEPHLGAENAPPDEIRGYSMNPLSRLKGTAQEDTATSSFGSAVWKAEGRCLLATPNGCLLAFEKLTPVQA